MRIARREFSKWLLLQESILIWITTIAFIILAFICVSKGYLGSLPWIATLTSCCWGAYAVSQAFYYNKSKAENIQGGVVFEKTIQKINNDINTDYGI